MARYCKIAPIIAHINLILLILKEIPPKLLESLSMTFTADGKRRTQLLIFYSFLVILKSRWGGGGYPQKNWVGVCGLLPKTLTLFMTKICDIPNPIYDLTFKSKPSSDQCYITINIICEGLLLIFFLIMMKKWLLLKIILLSRLECKNHTLFMTKMAEIS